MTNANAGTDNESTSAETGECYRIWHPIIKEPVSTADESAEIIPNNKVRIHCITLIDGDNRDETPANEAEPQDEVASTTLLSANLATPSGEAVAAAGEADTADSSTTAEDENAARSPNFASNSSRQEADSAEKPRTTGQVWFILLALCCFVGGGAWFWFFEGAHEDEDEDTIAFR